ncbi:hypothetical protein [Streptosporangium sp. NPDC000396]|uniref:hypothetical protein n=1 Tax=Streptosporangium sp. NPDC000396 TaxID=3366185 RepID=UPI0036A1E766
MLRVADLVEQEVGRAAQEALARGDELVRSRAVQLVRFSPSLVIAEVDDGAACVELRAVDGVLRWHCTCPEGRNGGFCAHCVATARSARSRASGKEVSTGVARITS